MTFNEYQTQSRKTAVYPKGDKNFELPIMYPALGLVSEAGEVAGKIKKIYRDEAGKISAENKHEIAKELGDVLWYVAQLSTELDLTLEDVAQGNLDKLFSRLDRGAISGSGDNR